MAGTVTASIQYLKKLPLYEKEKPFQLFIPIDKTSGDPRSSNLEFEPRSHTFVDIRNRVHDFSLDSHGFQVVPHPTKLEAQSFVDRSLVESRYLLEVEEVLRTIGGGYDKVFIFDWRVRRIRRPRPRPRPAGSWGEVAADEFTTGPQLCDTQGSGRV